MKMKAVQVPADVFLALARIYKQHKEINQMTPEERRIWLETHRLEQRAQSTLDRARKANHETGSEQHGEAGPR